MKEQTPRERRHARTRQAILDAAQQIIAEQGPDSLSMRTLAERIEYSPSGLYEYFRNKEEILKAICDEGLGQLSAYLTRVPQELSPAERVVRLGIAYLDFAAHHRELYLLMFGSSTGGPLPMQEINQSATYQQLKQAVVDGISVGTFQTNAQFGLEEMTYQCWMLVHGMAMARLTLFQDASDEIDTLNRRVLEGAIARLSTA